MSRYFFLIIIMFTFLQSETFEERQKTLQDIKNIVQYEESVARTYEQYILNNYKLPTIAEINTLLGGGNITSVVSTDNSSKVNVTTLTSGMTTISYALKESLSNDSSIKSLYESNTFRKRTYVRDSAVYFILEDSFSKHLFDLIKLNSGKEIKTCSSTNSDKTCIKDNHIFIDPTYTSGTITGYLMSYYIDKFKTGPIIITKDTTKHTQTEFNSIPKGTLLYDTVGVKYVKTTSDIKALK